MIDVLRVIATLVLVVVLLVAIYREDNLGLSETARGFMLLALLGLAAWSMTE